jgi:prepilin-type N-terminal cleavage/methylation domain-containing protein
MEWSNRAGFSLVEIIAALLILSVGVIALGAATGNIMTQTRKTDLRSERMAAVRQASETLRGADWETIPGRCESQVFATGRFTVSCSVTRPASNLLRVQLVSRGPGYARGSFDPALADTVAISLARPVDP